jgi:hypothetical protein
MRRVLLAIVPAVAVLAVGAGCARTTSGRGFTDADVAKVEQSIKTEFARRSGLRVEAVKMVKESPTRLTGIAQVRTPSLGMVEKTCEAGLGDRGLPHWQCN